MKEYIMTCLAGWQSGYAAACKAVYAGSIPASASIILKNRREGDFQSSFTCIEIALKESTSMVQYGFDEMYEDPC